MEKIDFDEATHTYKINGIAYPSVTEIVRFCSIDEAKNADPYAALAARERGTEVHAACEYYDYTGAVPEDLSEESAPYVAAYIQFLRDNDVKWKLIEHVLGNETLGYCGTLDRMGTINGVSCILDLKTSARINVPSLTAQLQLYDALLQTEREDCGKLRLFGLQLMRDGKYRIYECDNDSPIGDECLYLHRSIASMKGKRYAISDIERTEK
jgi:hypothetical protein